MNTNNYQLDLNPPAHFHDKWHIYLLEAEGHYKPGDIIIAEREGELITYDEYQDQWLQIKTYCLRRLKLQRILT